MSRVGDPTMCEHSIGWRPEEGVPDLAMMTDITDQGINVNLKTRYKRDQIYTFAGSILIAMNPYKQLDIYNQTWTNRYREQPLDRQDPHIFALTEAMYMNLVSKSSLLSASRLSNQACVISGESGAGKTETTKFILSYLCSITPNKSTWMEHQILEANTILEALGNSKTVRNDNSSRFGKFIQICFDSRHQINGCIIQDYLLEQSRITYQSVGERNYHVFYQLIAAGQASDQLRRKFHLMPTNFYNYLNQTDCYTIEGVDDCAMFNSLRTAMSVLNMEQAHCDGLFSILSAILWLGNLQFKADESSSSSKNSEQCELTQPDEQILSTIAELLGLEANIIEPILLRRQISVRGSVTEIPFRLCEARDNRNAIAKALYYRLFTWLVNFINASTNPTSENRCFLGVLDIFGFENFDCNSFEQLCINYANEKLHKFFNHHMFAMEQELYKREGIEFSDINYTDNTPCLELLERPPNCILRLLSEECRVPKGDDTSFVEKLHTEFATYNPNPFYTKGADKRNWHSQFSVRHYAGSVTYKVSGFLKKNKDSQQTQLLNIISHSSNTLLKELALPSLDSSGDEAAPSISTRRGSIDSVQVSGQRKLVAQKSLCSKNQPQQPQKLVRRESLFAGDVQSRALSGSNSSSNRAKATVADAFRQDLAALVELLNSTNPWYVRCIKPNPEKTHTDYDDRQVLCQLKYLGMSDLIRIRREGYPIHFTKHQFVCRYRCLMLNQQYSSKYKEALPPIKLNGTITNEDDQSNLELYCKRIVDYLELNPNSWKLGKTLMFLKPTAYQPLEKKRNQLLLQMATLIQSHWRATVKRREFKLKRKAACKIQDTFRAYRGRLLYMRKKRAVLTIQAYLRGMFAREIANAMRQIKQAEQEKARQLQQAERDRKRLEEEELEREKKASLLRQAAQEIEIIPTETSSQQQAEDERCQLSSLECQTGASSPCMSSYMQTNSSPAVSSSTSWIGQDLASPDGRQSVEAAQTPITSSHQQHTNGQTEATEASSSINVRDRREMEELARVLEQHGVSLDRLDNQAPSGTYADLERLYDILGNQIGQLNADAHSMTSNSIMTNDDDRSSFSTTATNGDGDSASCCGRQDIPSSPTDNDGVSIKRDDDNSMDEESSRDETVNGPPDENGARSGEGQYQSNSIESIASILSGTSAQSSCCQQSQLSEMASGQHEQALNAHADNVIKQIAESQPIRSATSTFTGGAPLMVAGSKLVTNGRPLTRIEEEPNSTASSPMKNAHNRILAEQAAGPTANTIRSAGLFPPESQISDPKQPNPGDEGKKRRLERKILQVQQEQLQQTIEPTTSGLPVTASGEQLRQQQQPQQQRQYELKSSVTEDQIYSVDKSNIIEYAEQVFGQHPRIQPNNANGMIRTLTRRRKSNDSLASEYLTKAEMLSYNSSFVIPSSHIKMHDPHNVQISCSMFKNLCKYMTGESSKSSDTEIRIIQSIIRHGIERSELRDEIYVQIVRQLTNNPHADYCLRLWALLGLVSAAFSPSKPFNKHLIAYLRNKPRKDPSITCHAQFCLDNLQAPRLYTRRYPPSPIEIQACSSLSNLTCKVHLLDGRCETLSVHPCDTAHDTLTKLAQKIGLQSIEGWALYESYTPGASKFPHADYEQQGGFDRSIRLHHYMADVVATWSQGLPKKQQSGAAGSLKAAQKMIDESNFKLTLKKKIFRGPRIRNDHVEIGLLYAQAVYSVVKKDNFLVDESLALSLAGLQAQIMLGNAADIGKQPTPATQGSNKSRPTKTTKAIKNSTKHPTQIYEVESYICHRLRNQITRSKKEWAIIISQSHRQFHGVNEIFCKMRYLSMVIYHCPLYGTTNFKVSYKGYQGLDHNLMLGINSEGLVIIRLAGKELVSAYRYADISPENGITVYLDEKLIQISVRDRTDGSLKCLTFESVDSEEIAMLMLSYYPSLSLKTRGNAGNAHDHTLDPSFDISLKKKQKLKMTLEDRMRVHQEIHNARRAIIKSGKLRKPVAAEEHPSSLLKHTLKRFSSSTRAGTRQTSADHTQTRFESIYGFANSKSGDIHSDYNLYGSSLAPNNNNNNNNNTQIDLEADSNFTEVSGATAPLVLDDLTKMYSHRFWAYTRQPLKSSLLLIHDSDLEEAALANFTAILTYSGLLNSVTTSCVSALETISIDSGIASQQSLSNGALRLPANGSPSSTSTSSDIYEVCPKKLDERELLKLAQSILDRCLRKDADILKNEFFLQLIKQTTDHPDPNSEINKRHWQLLALASSVTYPSNSKILAYLYAHLRRCSLDQVTDEGLYAQFTLRSLQGTLDTKGRRYAPSEAEILSTINCRRVYAKVYFLDDQFQAVEFDPCATIAEVIEQIKHKIGLKQDSIGYALFQPLDEHREQVLQPEEKVGDAIAEWETWQKHEQQKVESELQQQQQTRLALPGCGKIGGEKASLTDLAATAAPRKRAHKFVFKRYLFIESLINLMDPVERELLYYQTVASIKEDKFPTNDQEATILCALKAQIEMGDYTKWSGLPREQVRIVYKRVIMSLMPPHAFNSIQIPAIAQQHQGFRELSSQEAKKYFFNLVQSFGRAILPNGSNTSQVLLHMAHIYEATQTFSTAWPSDIWIVINQIGLHVAACKSRTILTSCEYRQIVDYNHNSNCLMLIVLQSGAPGQRLKCTFYTKYAQQIAQQMKDYIVITSNGPRGASGGAGPGGGKRKKSVEFNIKEVPPSAGGATLGGAKFATKSATSTAAYLQAPQLKQEQQQQQQQPLQPPFASQGSR